MKQVGYFFIGMGVVLDHCPTLFLELKRCLVGKSVHAPPGHSPPFGCPKTKTPEFRGLHWRIAIIIATMSTFVIVWLFFYAILPKQNYAMQVTLFMFGMLAFLFNYLDKRKSRV
ncbi:MAG: hypothetical protein H6634_05360 [Anaerolineales bacterium]|nr:hypothetical protein [Anaerolineales bacterium]